MQERVEKCNCAGQAGGAETRPVRALVRKGIRNTKIRAMVDGTFRGTAEKLGVTVTGFYYTLVYHDHDDHPGGIREAVC